MTCDLELKKKPPRAVAATPSFMIDSGPCMYENGTCAGTHPPRTVANATTTTTTRAFGGSEPAIIDGIAEISVISRWRYFQ
jgi:hypothetical protein